MPPGQSEQNGRLARLDRDAIALGAVELGRRDAVFEGIVMRHGQPPLWQRPQTFRTLVHIVLEQKVSLVSAQAVMRRVEALCPRVDPTGFLALPESSLRTAGVSGRKVDYCRSMAQALVEGSLSLAALRRLDDEAVMECLVSVRGIGPWTAGVYLTMALCRPDAWPSGDRALAVGHAEEWRDEWADGSAGGQVERVKGVGLVVPTYAELDRIAEGWRPWRGVASRLIWHAYLARRQAG